jgi:hypothetical protein
VPVRLGFVREPRGHSRKGLEGWNSCREFKCMLHGTKTLNTRGLEPRKLKDKEGKVVTDRQRNKMVKAKKDCGFNYPLSHKTVSKGSEERKYVGTLKCLTHTHKSHLSPSSFKAHEKSTVEYKALVEARKCRIGKVSYTEGQQLLKQARLEMIISQKTFYYLQNPISRSSALAPARSMYTFVTRESCHAWYFY